MNRLETALGVFGVFATLFGVGLMLDPGMFHTGPVERLTASLASAEPMTLMLVLGLVTGVLIAVAAWPRTASTQPTDAERQFDETVGTAPRAADSLHTTVAGADLLGADLDTAIQQGGEAWDEVQSMLAETAASTYAQAVGVPPATARATIKRGDWTADDLAAGALSGETPPVARLRMRLVPERERRRRVERTVAAIEQLREFQQGQR